MEQTELTEQEIHQENEIRLVGISRSGNHAVVNWIINQLEGSYCFLNCTEPKHNPFITARPLDDNGIVYKTNIKDFALEKEQQGILSKKDFLIYNHEDCFLGSLNKKKLQETHQKWVGRSGTRKDVLILRDPFNVFASRIKAGLLRGHYTHHGAKPISLLTLKRIYKQHAREYLGEKNNLRNKVNVNFNFWTVDEAYRKEIATRLEIPFSDRGFKEVPQVAGGSSFDGIKFSGAADKMNVHSRWKQFAEDQDYRQMFDEELVELTRKIFGDIPPLKYFGW